MILVIGGVYQGKLAFAKKRFGLTEPELCCLADGFVPGKRCYYGLSDALRQGRITELPDLPEDAVVIAEETGSGVVPMDPRDRSFRDLEGLLLQELAQKSAEVWRVFCGIPERLK